jgi:hypothetical protein
MFSRGPRTEINRLYLQTQYQMRAFGNSGAITSNYGSFKHYNRYIQFGSPCHPFISNQNRKKATHWTYINLWIRTFVSILVLGFCLLSIYIH